MKIETWNTLLAVTIAESNTTFMFENYECQIAAITNNYVGIGKFVFDGSFYQYEGSQNLPIANIDLIPFLELDQQNLFDVAVFN